MSQVLIVDDDPGTLAGFRGLLSAAGYEVLTAPCGVDAVACLAHQNVDLILADLKLPDFSGLDLLRQVRRSSSVPIVIVTGFGSSHDAVEAMRLGAHDFVEKPLFEDQLLQVVRTALAAEECTGALHPVTHQPLEAHAVARWALALVPIIDAPKDPRTLAGWARWVAASPGALRNWCRTAGIPPRRSLVFARLLRAVFLGQGGRHKPENLIDVVDRRTLTAILRLGGMRPGDDFAPTVDEFLQRQTLVRDTDALREIKRAIGERQGRQKQLFNKSG
jgi:CheY-like chemotaxis protein